MAFLKYRSSATPAIWSSDPAAGPLTNDQIDSNFATLNSKKPDKDDVTLQLATTNGSTTDKLVQFTNANGLQSNKIQAYSGTALSIYSYAAGTVIPYGTTTVYGDFTIDNVSDNDSAGAAWSLSSPHVTISSFTYPRFDAFGTMTKRTGYWYSPTDSLFGGIRLGSSTSTYLYSADFYQQRTEIWGSNLNSGPDYAALKLTQSNVNGLAFAIVAGDQQHLQLKASVAGNDRGPRISLNHTDTDRGDVLSFLINPYSFTGGVVNQYVEMGWVGPYAIGGNTNVVAGTIAANAKRYMRGFQLSTDAGFYKDGANSNHIIISGGYQDYSTAGGSFVTKYAVSGYAIKQEMNWSGSSYDNFAWYISDSGGPHSAGTLISGWNQIMKAGTDTFGNLALIVSGAVKATGDVVAYLSSDISLKTNITKIDNALNKVNTLDGVTFNWNEKAVLQGKDQTKREAGIIAQQVEQVLPEVVVTREDGTLAVDYQKMVPLLVEAIKELTSKVEDLQNQLMNK